jgi:hypothetical protein
MRIIQKHLRISKLHIRSLLRCACWLSPLLIAASDLHAQVAAPSQEMVRPSLADPAVREFDENNVILTPPGVARDAPLAIFLPGTNGKPMNALRLMNVVAGQGYRVIGLSYNDAPAVAQVCPRDPNPQCAAGFREMRIFGQGPALVTNPDDETIEARLAALLQFLNREHPDDGWSQYLAQNGRPQWSRIAVSGLSQGAGMAAYIAKTHLVYRVVLFSSPWDTTGRDRRPAPWLYRPSATPTELWWAERHVRENTTELIANAYGALRIPKDHILLFDQGLVKDPTPEEKNPYHPSTIMNPAYEPQWRVLYGTAGVPEASGTPRAAP